MDISMIGIDYGSASVELREQFAFTASRAAEFARAVTELHGAEGCVVLSTCNRTEIWCSGLREELFAVFAEETGHPQEECRRRFTARSGEQAVRYLFELGCGMHSQIFGEDQILAQLKTALQAAHEQKTAGPVLETLFRTAIAAAKRVKTQVHLTAKDRSVPESAVSLLERRYGNLEGNKCLVIGNGEMGRMTCELLVRRGCEVLMTLRQYKRAQAVIPAGCSVVLYEERYRYIAQQDFIFSATLSPHHTLTGQALAEAGVRPGCVLVDLAVPRDIDPAAGQLPGVTLYDMDALGGEPSCSPEALAAANALLDEAAADFESWYYFREFVPMVADTARKTAELAAAKLMKPYRRLASGEMDVPSLQAQVNQAVQKSVEKLLFGLKESLERDQWQACLRALEISADRFSEE